MNSPNERGPWRPVRVMFVAGIVAAVGSITTGIGTARADEILRHYEQSLHDQGFYFGTVDGNPGDELTQAVRRYQIRNGLPVTGDLDDATRKSIDKSQQEIKNASHPTGSPGRAASTPSRKSNAAATPDVNATPPPLDSSSEATPAPPAARAVTPPVNRPAPPDAGSDGNAPSGTPARFPDGRPDLRVAPEDRIKPSAALTGYLEGTPYEFAPPPVQADVVRRAQNFLLHSGFYDGPADGRPNADLAEALQNFQEVNRLRRSGRLDMNTLGLLRLLPDPRSLPARRYSSGGQGTPQDEVYQGRIVQ
jgi:peptidoglycan hydrolase-like protein with peptidoglycan-binding domain